MTKTYLGLITDETNEAQAFGFLALCWGAGGILGPAIGGLLSQPSDKYPSLFPKASIWEEYPFLLPCLVTSAIPGSGVMMALLFMKEPDRTGKRHRGKMAQSVSNNMSSSPASTVTTANRSTTVITTPSEWEEGLSRTMSGGRASMEASAGQWHEMTSMSDTKREEVLSQVVGVMAVAQDSAVYMTVTSCLSAKAEAGPLDLETGSTCQEAIGGSARRGVSREGAAVRGCIGRDCGGVNPDAVQHVPLLDDDGCEQKDVGVREVGQDEGYSGEETASPEKGAMAYVLGRKALVSTMAYAIMRLIVIGLDDALPLMMSTPQPNGMGMDSNSIGLALFGQGILLVSHVLFIFPYLKDRLGTLQVRLCPCSSRHLFITIKSGLTPTMPCPLFKSPLPQLFWLSAVTVPFVCWVIPFVADLQPHVPPWFFYLAVEASMGLKCFSFATGFTAVTLLINNSAPARVIGTINGTSTRESLSL